MRNLMIVGVCAFFVMLSMSTEIWASGHKPLMGKLQAEDNSNDDISVQMEVDKTEFSDGEEYEVFFGFWNDALRDVKVIKVKIPKGKQMEVRNKLELNEIELSDDDLSYEEFQSKYPEGQYKITFAPRKFGGVTFDFSYDFPTTPVITSPEDGATDVSTTLTIEWEPLEETEIDGFALIIANASDEVDLEFYKLLSADATSFTVPADLLEADTEYEIDLAAYKQFSSENSTVGYIVSVREITITTEPLLEEETQ